MKNLTIVLTALMAVLVLASSAQAGVLESGLQAYWNFDSFDTTTAWPGGVPYAGGMQSGTTGIFSDVTGNGNAAYAGNTRSSSYVPYRATEGKFGGAFYAENDGHNNNGAVAVVLNSSDIDFGNEDFTITLWEKSTQYRGNGNWGTEKHRGAMIAKFKDTATDKLGWRFGLEQGNYGLRRDGTRGSSTDILTWNYNGNAILQDGDPANDGFFGHYVVTYDASAMDLRIYENGVMKAENTNIDTTDFSSDSHLSIGAPLDWGIGTSGSFGVQGILSGLSNGSDPAWVDDVAMIGETLTGAEVTATYSFGTKPELLYDLGSVIPLLDAHRDAGSTVVGDLTWSYATGLTGNLGEVTGSGTDFQVMLTQNGTGLIGMVSEPIPEPSTLALAALGLLALGLCSRRRRRTFAQLECPD